MSRRLLLVLSAGALAATGLFTSGAAKAATAPSVPPSGGACVLSGVANFTPGLQQSGNFNYSFGGTLSSCQSSYSNAPASGDESAGQTISYNGSTYQEPAAQGSGGCSNSTTSGVSITKWADGDYTVVSYTTTGAGAAVALNGTVIAGVPVTGVNGTTGTVTISTNEPSTPVGSSALGELTFTTGSPTDVANCAGTGLTTANINGLIEIGQA